MKTLTLDLTKNIFNDYKLTNEEMICVRGGDDEVSADSDPIAMPTRPPVKI